MPALGVLTADGGGGAMLLMVGTQVVLSLELPFAVAPLVRFTSSHAVMGRHANALRTRIVAFAAAAVVTLANGALVVHFARSASDSVALRAAAIGLTLVVTTFYVLVWGVSLRSGSRSVTGGTPAR